MTHERSKKRSNIFRILRLCMGLSLNDMADKCKVSAVYLNELERGIKTRPSTQVLKKIADACGIQLDTLCFFIEDHNGEALNYQKVLLQSLEEYAQSQSTGGDVYDEQREDNHSKTVDSPHPKIMDSQE